MDELEYLCGSPFKTLSKCVSSGIVPRLTTRNSLPMLNWNEYHYHFNFMVHPKITSFKWPIYLVVTALVSTSCGSSAPDSKDSSNLPKVVATSSVLCDLTQQIAEQTIDLTCLIKPGVDPHAYALSSRDRKAIEQAQLVLYNGYGLEPNLEKAIQATSADMIKVAVAEEAVPKPLLGASHDHGAEEDDHEGEDDHAGEDDHGHAEEDHDDEKHEEHTQEDDLTPDPHVWHSPKQGVEIVTVLEESLTQLVPDQADTYAQNSKAVVTELGKIDTWIQAQIQTIPEQQRKLFTTHEALAYFANTYGLTLEGALQGFSTEEKPAAARVKDVVEDIKTAKVPVIFVESGETPKLMQTVAKEAGVQIASTELFADSLGEENSRGSTYQTMLIANTETIVKGLGGQYTAYRN